jgi:hypothetical protein
VPTLDELLEMGSDSMTNLSVKSLKAILFHHHVNASYIVEKRELVEKVQSMIEAERRDRDREAEARREEEEILRQDFLEDREWRTSEQNHTGSEQQDKDDDKTDGAKPAPKVAAPKSLERNGLCVICQDDEASIAIVDCGYVLIFCVVFPSLRSYSHLAMCRDCSDLIMSSTRECPLCRTRIVTEARLLRIFKSWAVRCVTMVGFFLLFLSRFNTVGTNNMYSYLPINYILWGNCQTHFLIPGAFYTFYPVGRQLFKL